MMKIALYNFLQQPDAFKFQHRSRFVVWKRNGLSGIGHDVYFDSVKVSSAEARTAVDFVSCAFYHCLPYVSCPRCEAVAPSRLPRRRARVHRNIRITRERFPVTCPVDSAQCNDVMSWVRVCRKQALSRVKYYYYATISKIQQATIMTV